VTLDLINDYFPPGGRVLDLGGGPGRYTAELLKLGYHVVLLDLTEGLLEKARDLLDERGLSPEAVIHADARDLAAQDLGRFHAALMLGPMYHVVDRADRIGILRDLHASLHPGGVAIVAYISSWGVLLAGFTEFPEMYDNAAAFRSLLDEVSWSGQFQGFTECAFSTPDRARAELEEAGFSIVDYAGCESFTGGLRTIVDKLADQSPQAYLAALEVARDTARHPHFRNQAEHLHFVVRKVVE
jgi:SAM-dependent methyltransferase